MWTVCINLFTEIADIADDKMNFDELLMVLGEFGTYQKCVYFLLCLLSVSSGIHTIISVFLLGIPHHRCVSPVVFAVRVIRHTYNYICISPRDSPSQVCITCCVCCISPGDSP